MGVNIWDWRQYLNILFSIVPELSVLFRLLLVIKAQQANSVEQQILGFSFFKSYLQIEKDKRKNFFSLTNHVTKYTTLLNQLNAGGFPIERISGEAL